MQALPPKSQLTKDDIADSIKVVLRYLTARNEKSNTIGEKKLADLKTELDLLEREVGKMHD